MIDLLRQNLTNEVLADLVPANFPEVGTSSLQSR